MINIKILGIEISHGKKLVNNKFYFEHFRRQGKDVEHFFEDVMGRNVRYEIDKETENALTLARESSTKVLKKCNLTGKDIDMIIYTGTLPEYATPISALFIHNIIKGKRRCFCHDMNLNCLGMTYAFDMASRYMATNKDINKILIVGGDVLTCGVNPENENNYGQFGDVSCAVICERTDEDCKIIKTCTGVDTTYIDRTKYPKCGFSHAFEDLPKEEMYADWHVAPPWWIEGIEEDITNLLKENNLTIDDISMFCFTQIAIKNIKKFREFLNIPEEKSIFVADRYGYTGTSSPFLALYESIKQSKVKRGDYVIMATSAAGGMYITELIKY